METKLMTLAGPKAGPQHTDSYITQLKKLPNKEVGRKFLFELEKAFPELTLNDLLPENWPLTRELMLDDVARGDFAMAGKCDGWWDCTKSFVGDTKDNIVGVFVDVVDYTSSKGGDTVRLFTSEEVTSGVKTLSSAYLPGGGSESDSAPLDTLLEMIGLKTKKTIADKGDDDEDDDEKGEWIKGINNWVVGIAGGVVAIVIAKKVIK